MNYMASLNSHVLGFNFPDPAFLPTHCRSSKKTFTAGQWQQCEGRHPPRTVAASQQLMLWKKWNSTEAAPVLLSGPWVRPRSHVGKFSPEHTESLLKSVHSSLTAVVTNHNSHWDAIIFVSWKGIRSLQAWNILRKLWPWNTSSHEGDTACGIIVESLGILK